MGFQKSKWVEIGFTAAPVKQRGRRVSYVDAAQISTAAARGCKGCPLDHAKLQHPKMLPTGSDKADIYILGEAPGADEDEQGEQFVGQAGRTLRKALPAEWKRIRWNNTIRCRPPANREPATLEIECCRHLQVEDIERVKPKLILTFGNVPLRWLLGQDKITAWRGRCVPVRVGRHACWAMPMLHPSYINRARHQTKGAAIEEVFQRDLQEAAALLPDLPAPIVEDPADKDEGLIYPSTLKEVVLALEESATWPDRAIDIETKGLRPYAEGSKILSIALSNYERTYAFALRHREATWSDSDLRVIESHLSLSLMNGRPLIAQNSKFEIEWFVHRYGKELAFECDWQDTMAQAYVLDEREGGKGLEALTLMHLGMNTKLLDEINVAHLDTEPLSKVLPYNGHDAKYEYMLYHVQAERLAEQGLEEVYAAHNARAAPIAIAQNLGVDISPAAAVQLDREFKQKVRDAEEAIAKDKDVAAFKIKHGRFNPASPKDMIDLFYRTLHFNECKVDDKKFSTDESVLSQIKHPAAKLVLRSRQMKKLHGYVTPLLSGSDTVVWPDGKIHTNYNHNRTSTSRLSSDDPNLQNLPIRSAEGKRIRSAFVAPAGQWFVSFDYGQIEFRVIGMATQDKVVCDACWSGYDVHGEWAEKIAHAYPRVIGGKRFLKDKAAMKAFRTEIKNAWTFPLFYGSVRESVENNLRVPRGTLIRLHDEFWDMFEGVHNWQEKMRRFYREHGYVEMLTGRRRHGPLGPNEIINSPIQGTASEIVIDTSVDIDRMAYETKREYLYWRMNIHDDLTFFLPDAKLEECVEIIGARMVSRQHAYDFVNVPLIVEVKAGPNWAEQEEIGVFKSTDYGHKR